MIDTIKSAVGKVVTGKAAGSAKGNGNNRKPAARKPKAAAKKPARSSKAKPSKVKAKAAAARG